MSRYAKQFSLTGKVVFVTGATGLIGEKTCLMLAAAGARVAALDIKEGSKKSNIEYFDITDVTNIDGQLEKLLRKYKAIDGWVNLAYPRTSDWGSTLEQLTWDSLNKNVEMQMNATMWLSLKVALLMKKNKIEGSIVNFGSIYGLQANDFTVYEGTALSSPFAYSMIKAGITNGSRYLAAYFGKDNIRVNTICPGGVFDNQDKKFVKNYEAKVPVGRMARADEIAPAVVFCLSDASSYMTGSTLVLDGGWTAI